MAGESPASNSQLLKGGGPINNIFPCAGDAALRPVHAGLFYSEAQPMASPDDYSDAVAAQVSAMLWLRIAIELCRLQSDIKAELVHGPLTGKRVMK